WVINAIILDAKNPQRVILGTEREGVQISENGGQTFAAANTGFHHQHILDVAMDREHQDRALVVLTFDTNAFLATKDGGNTWAPLGPGLKRTDLKHVYASPNGWVATLNNGGLMKYEETAGKWVRTGMYAPDAPEAPAPVKVTKIVNGKKTTVLVKKPAPKAKPATQLAFQINDLAFSNEGWFAATSTNAVLISRDKGRPGRSAGRDEVVKQPAQSLEASSSHVWAISQRNLLYSPDSGKTWEAKELPFATAGNLRLHRVDDNNLFVTSNAGLYASKDAGRTWNRADIRDLQFQDVAGSGNALVVSLQRRGLLASVDSGKS